jgi:hypothetical protein
MISSKDKEGDIYVCSMCDKSNKLEQLKDKRGEGLNYASKKEYLDDIKEIGKIIHTAVEGVSSVSISNLSKVEKVEGLHTDPNQINVHE